MLKRYMRERVIVTAGLIALFLIGYFGVGHSIDPLRARGLAFAFDERIPFISHSVWIYLLVFPAALMPLFVVRCPRLFRRTAVAYLSVMAVSFICFSSFPVTSTGLRAPLEVLDLSYPSDWAVSVLYALDPPFNLFPSLHLSIASLAAISAFKANRVFGIVALISVGFIGVSVCTVKQHVLLDVLGGLALALIVAAVFLRSYRVKDGVNPAYSWRGPALYGMFLLLIYAGYLVAYFSK